MQGHVQTKFLLDDCHQHVDADGDPDLRPHSVLGSAVEAFDAQVLLDPLLSTASMPPSKRLPAANGEFQYVVRSEYKDHQHVAKEGELSRY